MSDLKVGDVCKEPARLAVGMRIRLHDSEDHGVAHQHAEMWLRDRSNAVWNSRDHGYGIHDEFIRTHGVTILALPEEAAKTFLCSQDGAVEPAAPSLDAVPVGSRWRRTDGMWFAVYTVTGARPGSVRNLDVAWDDGRTGCTDAEWLLAHATRIDEPAGAGKCGRKITPNEPRIACDREAGHIGYHSWTTGKGYHASITTWEDKPESPTPAMPPAGCAPGCEPAKPCRITIPVTDKGTRYECPAFAEERVKPGAMVLDYVDSQARDRYEARAMRDQRWEAMNAGPMVGRYRFNRR